MNWEGDDGVAIDAGDVLIVGAGPVGLLAALALAQAGAKVTVIEAEEAISDAPRAMVYFPSTMVALEELGILADIEAQGIRGTSLKTHWPDLGEAIELSLSCLKGLTYDYQVHCGQDIVARVAAEHARKLGVEILFNHRLVTIDGQPDGAIASVETPSGPKTFSARWLVGADGARSTVRKLIDVEFAGHTWGNRFVATNVYCDFKSLGYADANFVCHPTYMAVIAAIDADGLWRLTYQEDGSLDPDTFMERLPERYAYFIPEGTKFEIKSARPYTIHQRCSTTLRKGPVLLAGDAAHATNPCGGLGLTTGIWTGLVMADVLGAVINGEADETILDRYSEERRRVYWEVTSPGASGNKRMLEEADETKRRKDMEPMRMAAANPAIGRMAMTYTFKTIGDVLRPESRWRDMAKGVADLAGASQQG